VTIKFFTIRKSLIIFICSIIIFLSLNIYCSGSNKEHITYVLITVDTEGAPPGYGKATLLEQIHSEINGVGCGIKKMMDIAQKYNFPITFYLDITEVKLFGEEKIKNLVEYIISRNHDLQLHIDSLYLFDNNRPYLSQYSLNEQIEIIQYESNLFNKFTSQWPIAHRAGALAANKDTLIALNRCNIPIDSSFRYKYNKSTLQGEYSKINAISIKYGIVQLPITVFYLCEYSNFFGITFPPLKRLKKVDIDSCSEQELMMVLDKASENNLDVVTLFMHSWSLIKNWRKDTAERKPDIKDITDFNNILEYIYNNPKLSVISTTDFYKKYINNKLTLSHEDYIPEIIHRTTLVTYIRRVLKIDRSNYKNWIVALSLTLLIIILFFMLIKWVNNLQKINKYDRGSNARNFWDC